MTNEELLARCRDYLSRQHCIMWGQHFNIKDENLEEAAVWLAGEINEVVGDSWASDSAQKNGAAGNGKTPRKQSSPSRSASAPTGTGSAKRKPAAKPKSTQAKNDHRDARGRGKPALP